MRAVPGPRSSQTRNSLYVCLGLCLRVPLDRGCQDGSSCGGPRNYRTLVFKFRDSWQHFILPLSVRFFSTRLHEYECAWLSVGRETHSVISPASRREGEITRQVRVNIVRFMWTPTEAEGAEKRTLASLCRKGLRERTEQYRVAAQD